MDPSPSNPVRVLCVDDHPLVRTGIAAILGNEPTMPLVGEADNGRDAAQLVTAHKPDIAILDLSMPELNGLDATRRILGSQPETRRPAADVPRRR